MNDMRKELQKIVLENQMNNDFLYDYIIVNEIKHTSNKNGIFINLTNVSKDIIENIINYLKYVDTQEKLLNDIEDQKETLTNTFFKDNKDNICISINE